ncbi:MAG: hypothetical protein IIA62_09820 [Nitrospinae bacterium]|nr:hypothetical protein [Nitrospinota bacterium]
MDAYLFDTTILSIYLDSKHPRHKETRRSIGALHMAHHYISTVALAELKFGVELSIAFDKGDLQTLNNIINQARSYAVLDLSHHTAMAYAELKAKLAAKYLKKPFSKPKYLEEWVDKVSGQKLGVDENDLWMCAQA